MNKFQKQVFRYTLFWMLVSIILPILVGDAWTWWYFPPVALLAIVPFVLFSLRRSKRGDK